MTRLCRCYRLNKQCQPSESVRRRNGQKNQDSGVKTNVKMRQLETKLDTVVSILNTVADSAESSAGLRKLLDQQGIANKKRLPLPGAIVTPCSLSSPSPLTSSSCSTPLVHGTSTCTHPYEPLADETERYLASFRLHMLPHLPFIHLAPNLATDEFCQEWPFLFRAIVAVSPTSIQHKIERGREFKNILSQESLVENKSSLDLLLGLLTYVAWGAEQFLTKSETLSRLMMMAMSMVYDLGLDKPLAPDEHMIGPFVPDFLCPVRVTSQETGERLLERQRAALACFLLS